MFLNSPFSGSGVHLPLTAMLTKGNYVQGVEIGFMTEMPQLFLHHSLHRCVCILHLWCCENSNAKLQS